MKVLADKSGGSSTVPGWCC